MFYSDASQATLRQERDDAARALRELRDECALQGGASPVARVQEYMQHGAARRLGVLRQALDNIFDAFDPGTQQALPRDKLSDLDINLHAFLINLYGLFDCWAWAFLYRHAIELDRRHVGMFDTRTQRHLPQPLRDYLTSPERNTWFTDYLKDFRDALAHRIPPYVPPAEFTNEDSVRHGELDRQMIAALAAGDWQRHEELHAAQARLGAPSFRFVHSFSPEENPRHIQLHTQLISDAKGVIEFGGLFLRHWHERTIVV